MTDDGAEAVARIANVSRETLGKLADFVDLIRRWNPAENLVSPGSLPELWTRHIADCAQLPALLHAVHPTARRWVDIGSGAGLPGIVIALTGPSGTEVALVESNQRKCAFLRQVIRTTGAAATVHQGRAESVLAAWATPVDVVTARAVAPLGALLELAAPLFARGAIGLFPKGRGYPREVDEASLAADFDLVKHPSRIDLEGMILEVRNVRSKGSTASGR